MNAETPREILREEDKMAERQEVKRSQNPNLTMKNGKMNVVQRRKSCSLVGYWRIDQTVSGSCIICIFLLVYVKIEKCNKADHGIPEEIRDNLRYRCYSTALFDRQVERCFKLEHTRS